LTAARPGIRAALAWTLVALLTALGCGAFVRGSALAWRQDSDIDMGFRLHEYEWFREGRYPHPAIEAAPGAGRRPFSVYPPYAFPMLALFFEPGGRLQGRVVVELLSGIALLGMAAFGRRAVPAAAALAAVAGPAIAGNGSAMALGQFSIICVGLLVALVLLLERGRSVAAGCCWALAMLKPQIALSFAALFLVHRQWRGLVVGVLILIAASAAACWWTEVSPLAVLRHSFLRSSFAFTAGGNVSGPAQLAAWLGIDASLVQWASLAGLVGLTAGIGIALRRLPAAPDLLDLAGICGVLGALLVYHRHYDNVMLLFTLLAALRAATSRPSPTWTAAVIAMGLSVWIPQRLFEQAPGHAFFRPVVWSVTAALLAWPLVRHGGRPAAAEAGGSA